MGSLCKGDLVQVTGRAESGWFRIALNDTQAYVSDSYLITEEEYLVQQKAEEEEAKRALEEQKAQQTTDATMNQTNTNSDIVSQVVTIMNTERANNGVGPITESTQLSQMAQVRAQEIVSLFSHTRPNGTSCFTIFTEYGYAYVTCGENIAAGYSNEIGRAHV